MSITARIVVVALACSMWACTTSPRQPPEASEPERTVSPVVASAADEAPLAVELALIEPTPAMLRAALANDPDAMRDAAATALAGCQPSNTCPAQFASCTNWSTPSLCSSQCGPGVCICKPIWQCEGEPPEPRGTDTFNSFRICFNPQAQPCTEWQQTSSTFCGC
jgi:hypothetical protein